MSDAPQATVWVEREALIDRIPRWLAMTGLFVAFVLIWDVVTRAGWVSPIILMGILCASIGRISLTRRSISPSSSMTLVVGICTAARPERPLIRSFARGSSSSARAASSMTGRLRLRSVIVSRLVSAPVRGWV